MIKTNDALSRRTFVKGSALAGLSAAALGSGALAMFGCTPSSGGEGDGNDAMPEAEEKIVWSHCSVNCGCCCAWKMHVVDGVITYVETDDTGSDEFGQRQLRACGRGRSVRRWLQSPDRLNYPLKRAAGTKRGDGVYEQISWDEALDTIASELRRCIDTYGPECVDQHYASGVTGSGISSGPVGRLLNMAGGKMNWYGSYSSAAIAQAGTFTYGGGTYGSNFLTLQDNELVVLFGNAVTEGRPGGCGHTYDLAVMREQHNCRIISIDPRHTDTVCGQGGEWIPIRPGTDGALVAALAYELINNGWTDEEFLHKYCVGYDEETMPESAKGKNLSYKDYVLGTGYDMVAKTPAWASEITQIPEQRIIDLARELHEANPVYIAQGYGINRRANGEIASRAIMLLPQLLGQIGKPGMNDGRREGSVAMGLSGFPQGDNPVTVSLPTYEWPNYIDHGTELTALNAGLKGADKCSTSLKFMFNYAGNTITNQHGDINGTHDLMADDTKCEFVVTSDIFMTDSAKYSDIIIPDLAIAEQYDVAKDGYSDNMKAIFYGSPAYEPQFERRGIYEVCCDLAERLGFGEAYSEGKTREDWCREMIDKSRENNANIPTWDEGLVLGLYKEDPAEKIILKEFIEDPEANPLPTPSGKIEIYSEQLAEYAATWELDEREVISPIPLFDPGYNGYLDLTEEYPLMISGFASKAHTHSSYANNTIIASVTHDSAWINPVDAQSRGIKTGDTVRIFNTVGELRMPATVTPRVIPGTVCIPAGAWHDADMSGDRIDYGGCANTINEYRPTPLGKCNPNHSMFGQVLKA